jgi:hypothetical protein
MLNSRGKHYLIKSLMNFIISNVFCNVMRKDELVWDSIDELITYHEDELTRLNEAKKHIVKKYNK